MRYHIEVEDLLELNEHCNVYVVDKHAKIIAINDAQFQRFKGLAGCKKLEDIIGRSFTEFFSPEASAVILKENALIMETRKTMQFVNYLFQSGYKSFVFLTVKTPLYDEKNKVVGVFGMSHYLSLHDAPAHTSKRLSEREADCLLLLIQGKTSAEISEKFKLSKRTVETYIENIKNKLGCASKSELIDKVLHLGLNAVIGDVQPKSAPYDPADLFSKVFVTSAKINK
jgi:DNA-binding CsgD family transcriptional regulator